MISAFKATIPSRFQDRTFLTFEPLTLVPVQRKLIDPALLSREEADYLDAYHQRCRDEVRIVSLFLMIWKAYVAKGERNGSSD